MPVELITFSDYARRRGCDEKAVRKAIAAQRITTVERDGKKLIDPAVADIQWKQNTRVRVRPNAPPPPAGTAADAGSTGEPPAPPPPAYDDHKTRQAKADAERAELEVGKLAGRLIEREPAERGTYEAFRELRDAVFAAIKTQARKVIGLTEVREVELALEDEMRGAFDGWEQRIAQRLTKGAADA